MENIEPTKRKKGRPKLHKDQAARQREYRKRRVEKADICDKLIELINKYREDMPKEIIDLIDLQEEK